MFKILSAEDVSGALEPSAAVDAILHALRDGVDPAADPPRHLIDVRNGQMLLMPSEARAVAGVKLLGLAPGNTAHGLPRIQGVYVLFDAETLSPIAVLDGAALTTIRTAAVSLAAVTGTLLERPGDLHVVVFGRGPQAESHLATLRSVCAGKRVIASVTRLGRGDVVDPATIRRAGLVVCATTARVPLFEGADLAPDAVVIAVGSHERDVRELDATALRSSTVVVEDRTSALREAGDVLLAIDEGALRVDDLVELADVATGRHRLDPGERVVFKSTGMAWEDLAIAAAVVRALDQG